jgi:hypothetical protein
MPKALKKVGFLGVVAASVPEALAVAIANMSRAAVALFILMC